VVLIIAVLVNDRNGNSPMLKGPNNSLKLLAAACAQGLASVRYDSAASVRRKGDAVAAEKQRPLPSEKKTSALRRILMMRSRGGKAAL